MDKPDAAEHHAADIDDAVLQLLLAGLDLRHVQDIVDQFQQQPAAVVDVVGVFDVFRTPGGAEHLLHDDFRKADHGVQRRAQLVAHIGQELGLGPVGEVGLLLGQPHRLIGRLALGHVLDLALIVKQAARAIAHGAGGLVDPDPPSVLPRRSRIRSCR